MAVNLAKCAFLRQRAESGQALKMSVLRELSREEAQSASSRGTSVQTLRHRPRIPEKKARSEHTHLRQCRAVRSPGRTGAPTTTAASRSTGRVAGRQLVPDNGRVGGGADGARSGGLRAVLTPGDLRPRLRET